MRAKAGSENADSGCAAADQRYRRDRYVNFGKIIKRSTPENKADMGLPNTTLPCHYRLQCLG